MFGKKHLDLGIIIGENKHSFLSFDEYAEHFLLPFSPRFCNIDFAISSMATAEVKNIVVFVKRDKDIIQDYLLKGWPSISFTVLDYIDIQEKFTSFLMEFMKDHPLELIVIMKGNYPVWFDMETIKGVLGKSGNAAIATKINGKGVYSGLVVEKNIFLKKYENLLLDEANLEKDILEVIIRDFNLNPVEVQGYIMPFKNIKEYYDIHISMLDDYLVFDRFNAYVPIRGSMSLNISSNLGKGSYVNNSIVGENVEIYGKVENSVIFSNVKIGRNAHVKNSLILPGNHIGANAQIINSIIDEYSEDNTFPNIESYAVIGSESPLLKNRDFPDTLNFGVTLVGKDVKIPASTKIGGNCYIDSFLPVSIVKENKKLPDGFSLFRPKEE